MTPKMRKMAIYGWELFRSGGFKKSVEKFSGIPVDFPGSFRMPLNADDEFSRRVFDGFHHPVFSDGTDDQPCGRVLDRLVVFSVHPNRFSFENSGQAGAGCYLDTVGVDRFVGFLVVIDGALDLARDILVKRSAQAHV